MTQPEDRVLSVVLPLLPPKDLARCQAVCLLWKEVASFPEVRRAVFMNHWQAAGLVGHPRSPSFFEMACLKNFVRKHMVQRTDTLQMLAIKHGSDVTTIKRINNLITDHSLPSRNQIYIPVASAEEICRRQVLFEYCRNSCRDFAVLVSDDEAVLARRSLEARAVNAADQAQLEQLTSKLSAMLSRSMHIDDSAARYYLKETGGDLKKAMAMCEQDMCWENVTPGSRSSRRRQAQRMGLAR